MSKYSSFPVGSEILYGGNVESPRKGFKFTKTPSWGTIAKSKTDPNLIYVFEPTLGKEFWETGLPIDSLDFQRENGSWVRYDWVKKTNSFETIDFNGQTKKLDIKSSHYGQSETSSIEFNSILNETFEELNSKLDEIINLSSDLTDKINTDEILNFSPDSLKWWVKDILHGGQNDLNFLNDMSSIKQDIFDANTNLEQISDKILESLSPLGLKGVDSSGKMIIKDYVPVDPNATNIREDIQSLNSKWDSIDSAGIQTVIDKLENYQSPIKSGNTLGDDLKDIETMYDILSDATSGAPIGNRLLDITLNYEDITQNVGLNVDQSFTSIPDIGDGTLASISETLSYMSTNLIDKNDEKLVYINSSGKLIKETNTSLTLSSDAKELIYVDESGTNTPLSIQGKNTQMGYNHINDVSYIDYLDEENDSVQYAISGKLTQLSFDNVNNRLIYIDENGKENPIDIPIGTSSLPIPNPTDLEYIPRGNPWKIVKLEGVSQISPDIYIDYGETGQTAEQAHPHNRLVYLNDRDSAYEIIVEERDNQYIYNPQDENYWPDDLEDTMQGSPVWVGKDIDTHLFRLDYIPFYQVSLQGGDEIYGYPANDIDAEFWFPQLPGGYSEFLQSSGGTVIQQGDYNGEYKYQDEILTRGKWLEFILDSLPLRRVDSYGDPVKLELLFDSRIQGLDILPKYSELDNLLAIENPNLKYLVYIDEDRIPNPIPCGRDNLTTMYTELPQNIEELYPGIDLVDATPSSNFLHYIDERYFDNGLITKINLPPHKNVTSLIQNNGDLLLVHEGLDSAGTASAEDWLRIYSNVKDYDNNRTYNQGEMAYFEINNRGVETLPKNTGLSKVVRVLSQNNEWKNIYGDLDSISFIKHETDNTETVSYDPTEGSFIFQKKVIFEESLLVVTDSNTESNQSNKLILKGGGLDFFLNRTEDNSRNINLSSEASVESNIAIQTDTLESKEYPIKEDCKEYKINYYNDGSIPYQAIDLSYRNHFIYVDGEYEQFLGFLDDGLYKGQEIRLWICIDTTSQIDYQNTTYTDHNNFFERYSTDSELETLVQADSDGEKYEHIYEVGKKYSAPIGHIGDATYNFQTTGNVSVEKYRRKFKSKYKWNHGQTSDSDAINPEDGVGAYLENKGIIDDPGIQIIYDEIAWKHENSVENLDSDFSKHLPNIEKGLWNLHPDNIAGDTGFGGYGGGYDNERLRLKDLNEIRKVGVGTRRVTNKPIIAIKNAKYRSIKSENHAKTNHSQEFPSREDYQYIISEPEIIKFKVTSTTEWQQEWFKYTEGRIEDALGIWTGDYWMACHADDTAFSTYGFLYLGQEEGFKNRMKWVSLNKSGSKYTDNGLELKQMWFNFKYGNPKKSIYDHIIYTNRKSWKNSNGDLIKFPTGSNETLTGQVGPSNYSFYQGKAIKSGETIEGINLPISNFSPSEPYFFPNGEECKSKNQLISPTSPNTNWHHVDNGSYPPINNCLIEFNRNGWVSSSPYVGYYSESQERFNKSMDWLDNFYHKDFVPPKGWTRYQPKSDNEDYRRQRRFALWNGHYVNRSLPVYKDYNNGNFQTLHWTNHQDTPDDALIYGFWNYIYATDSEMMSLMPDPSYKLRLDHFTHSKQINHMAFIEAHKGITYNDIKNGYVFLDERIGDGSYGLHRPEQASNSSSTDSNGDVINDSSSNGLGKFKNLDKYLNKNIAEVYIEKQSDAILFHLDDNDYIISISKPNFIKPKNSSKRLQNKILNIENFEGKLKVGDSLVLHYPKKVHIEDYLEYKDSAGENEDEEKRMKFNFIRLQERYSKGLLNISLANFYKSTNVKPNGDVGQIFNDSTNTTDDLPKDCYLRVEPDLTDSAGVSYYGPAQKFQYVAENLGNVGNVTHFNGILKYDEHPFFGIQYKENNFTYFDVFNVNSGIQLNKEKPFYRFPEFLTDSGVDVYKFEHISEMNNDQISRITHTVNPVATLSLPENFDLDAWADIHRPSYFIFNVYDYSGELLGSNKQTVETIEESNAQWGLFEFENTGEWDIKEEKISECYYLGIPKPKYVDSSPLMYRCIWDGTHWILLNGSFGDDIWVNSHNDDNQIKELIQNYFNN